jgi:hypothetical protein
MNADRRLQISLHSRRFGAADGAGEMVADHSSSSEFKL